MLSIGGFFNNLINTLIRSLSYDVRILISVGFFVLALVFLYFELKFQPTEKPALKVGWLILFLIALTLSVFYIIF